MSDLRSLTELVARFRDERNWSQFHTPKDMVLSLMLEAAELAEILQWRNGEELAAHLADHREEVGDELADLLYWLLLIAHDQAIDIEEAFKRKMAKNAEKYPVEKARNSKRKYSDL